MSKADLIFKENCKQILEHGFSTENEIVRAKWEDGTPAHTIKTFGVVNRYDLQEGFQCFSAHDQHIACGFLTEIFQIRRNRMQQVAILTNAPFFINGYDQIHDRPPYSATGILPRDLWYS